MSGVPALFDLKKLEQIQQREIAARFDLKEICPKRFRALRRDERAPGLNNAGRQDAGREHAGLEDIGLATLGRVNLGRVNLEPVTLAQ